MARGEISTVPARVTAEAAAAATSVPEAVVSPPDADGAAPSPKKKKKRKVIAGSWLLCRGVIFMITSQILILARLPVRLTRSA